MQRLLCSCYVHVVHMVSFIATLYCRDFELLSVVQLLCCSVVMLWCCRGDRHIVVLSSRCRALVYINRIPFKIGSNKSIIWSSVPISQIAYLTDAKTKPLHDAKKVSDIVSKVPLIFQSFDSCNIGFSYDRSVTTATNPHTTTAAGLFGASATVCSKAGIAGL